MRYQPLGNSGLLVSIVGLGCNNFGGRLDLADLSLAERAIIAAARGKEGDHRDMAAVAGWAGAIADDLARAGSGL